MTKILTWSERCEIHPDHQQGMIGEHMIQARMQEEIKELRAFFAATPDRQELQATGAHPAPCARHCEATAFEAEIRRLKFELAQVAKQEPFAYFQRHPISGVWIEVIPSAAGDPGVVAAYRAPADHFNDAIEMVPDHVPDATKLIETERDLWKAKYINSEGHKLFVAQAVNDAIEQCAAICEKCGYDSVQGAEDIRNLKQSRYDRPALQERAERMVNESKPQEPCCDAAPVAWTDPQIWAAAKQFATTHGGDGDTDESAEFSRDATIAFARRILSGEKA